MDVDQDTYFYKHAYLTFTLSVMKAHGIFIHHLIRQAGGLFRTVARGKYYMALSMSKGV